MQLNVNVRYFALFRELTGRSEETLRLETGSTAEQLFRMLGERYAFPLGLEDVRVAVNDEFASFDRPLAEGDRVVFIPPVSGG